MDSYLDEGTVTHYDKFWVVGLPKQVFSVDSGINLRVEFEAIFHEYGEEVQFQYLNGLERVLVSYKTEEQASKAIELLQSADFQGTNIRVCPVRPVTIGSSRLGPPVKTKQFLISPPASPPVGWTSVEESAPTPVDYNLLAALSRLRLRGEQTELYHGTNNTPSIIVTNDDDDDMEMEEGCFDNDLTAERTPAVRLSALPATLAHTPRPPLQSS